jgi:hypothetical protein
VREVRVEQEGSASRIRFIVQNSGWLPTNVTKIATDRKLVRGVVGEICRRGDKTEFAGEQEPSWLLSGKLREEKGQLTGWSHVTAGGFGWNFDETTDLAVFEWVVTPGTYDLVGKHERAGTVRRSVEVGG